MFVKPEERRFVSAELISATSFIEALRSAGYTQFTIQLVPGHEHALADWDRIRRAFAQGAQKPRVGERLHHGMAKRSSPLEGSATSAPLVQFET